MLELATDFIRAGQVDGIRYSTRPDTINERSLDLIEDYPVSTVELGVQLMNDRVLALAGRGHSALDTVQAVERFNQRHLSIGSQMMVGLPGDDETFLDTAISAIESANVVKDPLAIFVNSRCISKMWGLNNSNLKRLKEQFHLRSIAVVPDTSLGAEELKIK